MEDNFHYLLMANSSLFNKEIMAECIKEGLTPGQPKVLDYLDKHNGSLQKEISEGTLTDPATLTGILTKMEKKGLIERRMKDGNRRNYYVYLTDLGKEKLGKVKEIFKEKEEKALEGFSVEEKEKFIKMFTRIYSNMIKDME